MSDFILSCCSTADLPKTYFDEKNIPFVCFHYNINGVEYPDDLGQTQSFKEFYAAIRNGAMPTTSQVNTDQFVSFFEPFLQQGKDILHLSFSSGLSGSMSSARIAADELSRKYPKQKLYVVDTLAASSGYGLLVDYAWNKKREGMDIDALRAWVEDNKLNFHHWFFSTDLFHYKRGGRVSGAAAVMGTMLHIRPLLNMSLEGKLVPRYKIRGQQKVIHAIVDKMEEHAIDGLDYSGKCFISESDCMDDARAVASLVEERFKKLNGKVMINSIGTVIGSHTGTGTVALFFYGDKRVD